MTIARSVANFGKMDDNSARRVIPAIRMISLRHMYDDFRHSYE